MEFKVWRKGYIWVYLLKLLNIFREVKLKILKLPGMSNFLNVYAKKLNKYSIGINLVGM